MSISRYDQWLDSAIENFYAAEGDEFDEGDGEEQIAEETQIDDGEAYFTAGWTDFFQGYCRPEGNVEYRRGWNAACEHAYQMIVEERAESIDHATSWQWA